VVLKVCEQFNLRLRKRITVELELRWLAVFKQTAYAVDAVVVFLQRFIKVYVSRRPSHYLV